MSGLHVCFCEGILVIKMSVIDETYSVKVSELMQKELCDYPRPKLRSRFLVTHDEILPIILVEAEV